MQINRWIAAAAAALLAGAAPACAETILFVGNSFTFGANSPAWKYRADAVTDLNGEGIGGVPALFKRFTEQAGLEYQVSLETAGGRTLNWHWENRRDRLDRAWDHVVLQEYSTLDPQRPGDPAGLVEGVRRLSALFAARNPKVDLRLMATWSRPDLVFQKQSPWRGKPIATMARELRAAYDQAAKVRPGTRVLPVGEGFNCAIARGVADANPYDGIAWDQAPLWSYDQYHASAYGYYLEALIVFAEVTGRDPRTLGRGETAATELGIGGDMAARLQTVAWEATRPGTTCR
ncbi:PEP-CTERM sorting domain-containing protein [Sphingomonas sp. 3-13AW]|uniref:PEP-CTERM sorting domain-containing protein n=1 Tax=Sphingomonas sp. 3-13AW TaxID=3050450 RepID=UPI003BB5ABF6